MFILDGFRTLGESYAFYFSSGVVIGISILIAIGRCFQALYKESMDKGWYSLIEFTVQVTRLFQYMLILCLGTDTSTHAFTSHELWDKIFLGLYAMEFPAIIWDFGGFVIVFGVYNLLLHWIFKKSAFAAFMNKTVHSRFSGESLQHSFILVYKNLFLIPVSFIYILIILKIM